MKKRIVSVILALCLILSAIPAEALALQYEAPGYAVPYDATIKTDVSRYFYDQLGERARVFYNALVDLYKNGGLKTGVASVELTEQIGLDAISAHMVGAVNLLADYGAARDAFYMDYPDIFYVDFSDITIRITQSGNDYHLYMGPGRFPTYYADGFESEEQVNKAIAEYEAALAEVLNEANTKTNDRDKIAAVHDYLTKHTTYRDEVALYEMYTATNDQKFADAAGSIRTAYGCLVRHMGVCESYTRAFKAAMDKLGIPCVMIYGVYQHSSESAEQHIWNAVEVDGQWFGVDVTMDDPISSKSQTDPNHLSGLDGYESSEYLMCGAVDMAVHHIADGIMSESGYEFRYPMVNEESYSETLSDENSPLKVRYRTEDVQGEEDAGVYYVSYFGMNGTEMKAQGYYLIMRNKVYDVVDGWVLTDWYYYMPEVYGENGSELFDRGHETRFEMPHVEYVEFGITDIPYPPVVFNQLPDSFFYGDESLLLARSGILHNQNGTYRAAPHVSRITPAVTGRMEINGKEHHVVAQYDDLLVLPEVYEEYCKTEKYDDPGYLEAIQKVTASDITLKVTITDRGIGVQSGVRPYDYSHLIKNLTVTHHIKERDGSTYTTVEFDFKPSEMWADDLVCYDIYLGGVVGAWSGKMPDSIAYVCAHPCAICCYRKQGFDYNCFAKPQLLSDSDLSLGDVNDVISNAEGTPFEEQLKARLMLVVSDSNQKDAHRMEEMIEEGSAHCDPAEVLSAESYNISLTLCKKQLAGLENGMRVRISCGFPYGYGPDDAGVTFKAYHYIKDDAGNITGIEEIPCTITPYGLLIECPSFSPFTIAAVKVDPNEEKTEKTLVLVSDVGGSVSANGNDAMTLTLKKGEDPVTVTVRPDEGYSVETVEISGADGIDSTNTDGVQTFKIGFEDITDENSAIVSAKFAVTEVVEKEVGRPVIPVAEKPDAFTVSASNGTDSITCLEGGDVTLTVPNANPAYTYRWFKRGGNADGSDAMIGTGAEITLQNVKLADSGSYYCRAVAVAGGSMESTDSENSVTVTAVVHEDVHTVHTYGNFISAGDEGHYQQCTYPGCEVKTETTAHTFNADGVCTVCDYEDQTKHTHRFEKEIYDSNAEGHAKICSFVYKDGTDCTVVSTERVPHDFDKTGKCTVCGYNDATKHIHEFDEEWHYDSVEGHYHRCINTLPDGTVCGEKSAVEAHDLTGAEHTCPQCGYKENNPVHSFAGDYIPDGDYGHYQVCTGCGSHSPVEAHKYNDQGICEICNYENESMHNHNAFVSEDYKYDDEQGHYKYCTFCGEKIESTFEEHKINLDTATCVCGFFRFESHNHIFTTDKTDKESWVSAGLDGHYTVCKFTANGLNCTVKSEIEKHTYDDEGICTVCGQLDDFSHKHRYEKALPNGDEGHYYICTYLMSSGSECGEINDIIHPHNYEGNVCTECGYEKKELHPLTQRVEVDNIDKLGAVIVEFLSPAPSEGTVTVVFKDGSVENAAYRMGDESVKTTSSNKAVDYVEITAEVLPEIKSAYIYVTVILGDVNGSGEVTLDDAILVLKTAMNVDAGDESFNIHAADLVNDGHLTLEDAIAVLKIAMSVEK